MCGGLDPAGGCFGDCTAVGDRAEAAYIDGMAWHGRPTKAVRVRVVHGAQVAQREGPTYDAWDPSGSERGDTWQHNSMGPKWQRATSRWLLVVVAAMALFKYTPKPKILQDSPSHRILRHMHGTLNIDKKDN